VAAAAAAAAAVEVEDEFCRQALQDRAIVERLEVHTCLGEGRKGLVLA